MFQRWLSIKVFHKKLNSLTAFLIHLSLLNSFFFSNWSKYSYDYTDCLCHLRILHVRCESLPFNISTFQPKITAIFNFFLGWTQSSGMTLNSDFKSSLYIPRFINCQNLLHFNLGMDRCDSNDFYVRCSVNCGS